MYVELAYQHVYLTVSAREVNAHDMWGEGWFGVNVLKREGSPTTLLTYILQ